LKQLFLKICDCFFLLRIFLLVPVWTVLILGWITGSSKAVIGGWVCNNTVTASDEYTLLIALVGFSLLVASIYVVNQIVDIESDRINHKLFILPNGLISVKTAWICALTCASGGFAISILYFDSIMTLLFGLSLILGICYNLPPLKLKNHAWGGVAANFVGHGMFAYLVGWYAANMGTALTGEFMIRGILASLTAGFANAAVFLTTTIPDTVGDKSTGKQTFCVVYGEKKTAVAAAISCACALFFAFFLEYNTWIMILQAAVSLVLFTAFAISTRNEFAFKTFRWPVFLLSTLVVLFIPAYGAAILFTLFICRVYYKLRFNYNYPTFKGK